MIQELCKYITEAVKGTDTQYMLLIRSEKENIQVSQGSVNVNQLFSMLVPAAEQDEAVRLAIHAASQFLREKDERLMRKNNIPGAPLTDEEINMAKQLDSSI